MPMTRTRSVAPPMRTLIVSPSVTETTATSPAVGVPARDAGPTTPPASSGRPTDEEHPGRDEGGGPATAAVRRHPGCRHVPPSGSS